MSSLPAIETIRHSFAHVLAAALEKKYKGVQFGVGPVIQNGFYYDVLVPEKLSEKDLKEIEKQMKKIIGQHLAFERSEMPIGEAVTLFKGKGQTFKADLLEDLHTKGTTKLSEEEQEATGGKVDTVSLYTTGDFTDLCRGPHVASTKDLNPDAFIITRTAQVYWRGKESNPQLTRVYGVGFATKQELDDYLKLQEEIEKRDHRKLGVALDLFSFHEVAPGPFWHEKGMIMVNEIKDLIRGLQRERGYEETSTPILVKPDLYKISGHLDHYKEYGFRVEGADEGDEYYLKPMNCPESTYIYSSKLRSYKDLPIKLSEFGQLHRKEKSGTLTGLLRVYGFVQDDAHIYARHDQIQEVISNTLDLIQTIHKIFNLKTEVSLGTRPEKAMGEKKLWDKAEEALRDALAKNKIEYKENTGDGAFYGPKIDINVLDALGRSWTAGTIQLDFQMPERFKLEYIDEKGAAARPVMIHRSSIGSFERFTGLLIEHYAGIFPLWLSPVQVVVATISEKQEQYAKKVYEALASAGIPAKLRDDNETIGKKIRETETQKIPYLLVVGDKEIGAEAVAVRKRGEGDTGQVNLDIFLKQILKEIKNRA